MLAYKFLKDDMTSGSGSEPPWEIGKKRTLKGKLSICERGYHSSPSWYDALNYICGNVAAIVEISKPTEQHDDKYVSHSCTIIKSVNVEKVLREWGCDCAERALKAAKVTDKLSWNAIKVARSYNEGKATKEEMAAAMAAAWAAAMDTARAAAWAVARAVAWAAARAAAWDTEIEWQRTHLDELINKAFEEAKRGH